MFKKRDSNIDNFSKGMQTIKENSSYIRSEKYLIENKNAVDGINL